MIELRDITKSFGKRSVLKQVSLKFDRGKFYALLGRNGAGKSTLMRILLRCELPDSGTGKLFDQDLDSDSPEPNFEIGYVSESLNYQIPIKIAGLFSKLGKLYPKWNQRLFDDTLKRLRLDTNQFFRELSRGQKMQVAFAAAIAIEPSVIVLDEITSVLDASARSYFMSYLGKFVKAGGTVLMATNIVSEVQHFADHIILLDSGSVKVDSPLADLSKLYSKLRRQVGQDHEVFRDSTCVELSVNSDKSTSYLIDATRTLRYQIPEALYDRREITAEELFVYYTREGGAA